VLSTFSKGHSARRCFASAALVNASKTLLIFSYS
jgi:hypothetical protein